MLNLKLTDHFKVRAKERIENFNEDSTLDKIMWVCDIDEKYASRFKNEIYYKINLDGNHYYLCLKPENEELVAVSILTEEIFMQTTIKKCIDFTPEHYLPSTKDKREHSTKNGGSYRKDPFAKKRSKKCEYGRYKEI